MNSHLSNPDKNLSALMADDDPGIRLTLTALLEQKGYRVTAVENGLKAVNAIGKETFDIILLDIRMPEMDGFEACRSIRDLGNGKTVPILMLTGQDDTESIQTAYDVGATDFVSKPINFLLLGFKIDYIVRASNIAVELRKSQQRSNNAQRIANLGHIEWSQSHTIEHFSIGVREILCLPASSPLYSLGDFLEYVHSDDRDRVENSIRSSLNNGAALNLEHRIIRPDGSVRYVLHVSEYQVEQDIVDKMMVTMQDITGRVDSEKRLHALAYYDKLTGLPNRSFLIQYLEQLLKVSKRHDHITATVVFGVDKLDSTVESMKHESVEDLIRQIADRIKNSCRSSDLLSHYPVGEVPTEDSSCPQLTAKLRNDEYVIILPQIHNLQSASIFIQRLMNNFEHPFQLPDRQVYLTACAGVSIAPSDTNSVNELIKFAEIAKGFAAKEGAGSFKYFKQSLNTRVSRRSILSHDLRKSLNDGMLEVYYQPKMSLSDNKIVGLEALTRWNHPTFGAVSPVEFIEIAEEENLINQLGEWVLKTACKQVNEWSIEFQENLIVSINISPKQLEDEHGMIRLVKFISDSPISNQYVELELTESSFMTDFEASLKILNQFKKIGCGLAIDDFGTGYSSFSYLGSLPASTLKIDRSFIVLIQSNSQYAAIVKGIIQLAHSLGLAVIAEGVENEEQKAFLSQQSCDEIQGNLVSAPLSAVEFTKWIMEWNTSKALLSSTANITNSVNP